MVHYPFDPSSVSFDDFDQLGSGNYFIGFEQQRGYGYVSQSGMGIGNVFAYLKRILYPLLKRAGKSVGKEALVTGARILDNIAQGAEFKATVKEEAKKGVKRVADKFEQSGSGIPKKRRKTVKKKKKMRITKKSILGKRILKDLVMKHPKTKLGFY